MLRAAGVLVGNRYELETFLGEGGFGEVWRARDTKLGGRASALKFLRPELLDDREALRRFNNEAEALGRLSHPNIVSIENRGEWGGHRFIAMEHVAGESLASWMKRQRGAKRLPDLEEVEVLFNQICAGVAAAHRVTEPGPIVHRDLKPHNVMLGSLSQGGREIKVLDFGIARLGQRDGTQTGQQMGTQLYMAPEQATGRADRIGPWTDVFSLGVLLVEMLTLEATPSKEKTWCWAVLRGKRPIGEVLERMRDEVPVGVWEVLARALCKDPASRLSSAGELQAALGAAWLTPKPTLVRRCRAKTRRSLDQLVRLKGALKPAPMILAVTTMMISPHHLSARIVQQRTCDEGDAKACVAEARRHEDGTAGQPEMGQAALLYGRACDLGDQRGCLELARMCARGLGVERDEAWALVIRRGLCELGELRGCADLGEMYAEGTAVERNDPRALQLYQHACDGGELRGCANLGDMYEEGRGVEQDRARARVLRRRACDGGDGHGCGGLAETSEPDFEQAGSLYERACVGGDLKSCGELALRYEEGTHLKLDDARAGALFSKACRGGEMAACFRLGERTRRGGTRSDRDKAREYYEIACTGGYSQACIP